MCLWKILEKFILTVENTESQVDKPTFKKYSTF